MVMEFVIKYLFSKYLRAMCTFMDFTSALKRKIIFVDVCLLFCSLKLFPMQSFLKERSGSSGVVPF